LNFLRGPLRISAALWVEIAVNEEIAEIYAEIRREEPVFVFAKIKLVDRNTVKE
jgi:hypothetical protein